MKLLFKAAAEERPVVGKSFLFSFHALCWFPVAVSSGFILLGMLVIALGSDSREDHLRTSV